MRAEQVTLYRCDVCGLHYHQQGLAEQCCSDELSKCAWEGCTGRGQESPVAYTPVVDRGEERQ